MSARKVRAIERLVALQPTSGREELLSRIMCGEVSFDGELVRDPKALVSAESNVLYARDDFVSRGGLKLDHALGEWDIAVAGKVVLDAGASTGGFTHALLRRGAVVVHAVDVGYNQLDYRLRTDGRVVVHERTNIMAVESLNPQPQFAVMDLSFRSLRGAARHTLDLTSERFVIALLKPQFEWQNPPEEFDGCVPDSEVSGVVDATLDGLRREGLEVRQTVESPIRGRAGNREFLLWIEAQEEKASRPSGAPM